MGKIVSLDLGRLRARSGRFLKKAPQKLFSGGQLYFASFLAEKLWLLCQSESHKAKRKQAFFLPYVTRTRGFFPRDARKESPENDLDNSRK